MTLAQLDKTAAALERALAAWETHALLIVNRKVDDAHAHARKALTDTLKETRDGRSSILRINANPSFRAALSRLDELWTILAGPSEVSLKGKVRDAREALLRQAMVLHHPTIPEPLLSRSRPVPTFDEVRQIRAAAIHNYDARKELEGPIRTAQRSLKAALERAGRSDTPGDVEDEILGIWKTQTANSISQTVKMLLSDSMVYADNEAGRALIHKNFIASVEK